MDHIGNQINEAKGTSARSESDVDAILLDLKSLTHRSFDLKAPFVLRLVMDLGGQSSGVLVVLYAEHHLIAALFAENPWVKHSSLGVIVSSQHIDITLVNVRFHRVANGVVTSNGVRSIEAAN